MFLRHVRSFLSVINTDAIIFLGTRLASIILSITSIILICRAVTVQQYFITDGLGLMYDMLPLGALAYTIAWSVTSLILPGCHKKYHPGLDMGLDFFGMALSFASGGALLSWALTGGYETSFCPSLSTTECTQAADDLSRIEKSGAMLLILTGMTHVVMFVRASFAVRLRSKKYVLSRNSFMQLEKEPAHRIEVIYPSLSTTDCVAAGQNQPTQNARPTDRNLIDDANNSGV